MWDCWIGSASQFFCFSPIFCFLFPFGSRAIRYYISTRTTVAVPTSNSLESEESIPAHYFLYVACTPRVACTVRLVLMCTCLLRTGTFTSNLFVVVRFLFTYEISTDGLSLILSSCSQLILLRVCCTIYRNSISPACQKCVTFHMYYS